jgi:RNA polymerase sigma-70 factor (ECF subfamily)
VTDETALVRAAQDGDEQAFQALVERHRSSLHAHCYRMLASPYDADDAVQEALVRAWTGLPQFRGESSLRTWLFRIATRTALDVATGRGRRELPIGAYPPSRAGHLPGEVGDEIAWIGPYPTGSPESAYLEHEVIEIAYIAALQYLPAHQRAVFLLRAVLKFPAAQVAEMLGTTVAGVNSRLQRARSEIRKRLPLVDQRTERAALGEGGERDLASRYARAIEEGDLQTLLDLLAADASWSMPPLRAWFKGHEAVGKFLTGSVFPQGWRHEVTEANGQLAVAGWIFDADANAYLAGALDVLDLRDGKISAVTGFLTAAGLPSPGAGGSAAGGGLFARFGLPDRLEA